MTDRRLRAICGRNDRPWPLEPRPHIHPGLEVGIVLSGEELVDFGDRQRRCQAGDVWLCGMWEPHSWYLTVADTRTVVLIFPPDFIGSEMIGSVPWLTLFALPPEDRPSPGSLDARRQIIEIGRIMQSEIERNEPHWERVVRLELLRLLTILVRQLQSHREDQLERRKRLSGLARLMPAFGLVHSRLTRRVNAKEAALACGMSPSRFHTVFRDTMKMTFGRFVLRTRLSRAAHELASTDHTIASIAAESGFTDDSHLHHCFRQEYGCTPSEYRARAHRSRERATESGVRFAEGIDSEEAVVSGSSG